MLFMEDKTNATSVIEETILKRISTRAYLPDKQVNPKLLKKVMELSFRAPSWKNAQGYYLLALTGEKKDALVKELVEEAKTETARPDIPYDTSYPPAMKKRMFQLGTDLFAHLNIGRKDKEARDKFSLRNFEGFSAPVLIFCYIPKKLKEWTTLDLGLMLGHLALTASAYNLGTCFQASLASYPDIVKKYTAMDDKWNLMVGLSLGYPDKSAIENSFRTERTDLENTFKII